MPSADVRAAVTAYLNAAAIPGLLRVHPAPPRWADGSEWDLARNLGSGAIGALHLMSDRDSREALPAVTGVKITHYQVALMLFYQFLVPSNSPTPVDESAWSAPLDALVDGVKAAIRADPNLGAPSVIWQAGQDENDIAVVRDLPRQMSGKVLSWQSVEFSVYEVITA